MTNNAVFQLIRTVLLACLLMFLPVRPAAARVDTNDAPAANTNSGLPESAVSQETLRSYLLIQEQLHNIERSNLDAEAAAGRDVESLEARLAIIEKSLSSQRLDELKEMQRSNRSGLIANGVFALIAFLALLFAAFLQWSAVNRLASVAAALSGGASLGPGHAAAALGMGETALAGGAVQESTTRLLGTLERLEKRILEMEAGSRPQHALPETTSTNGQGQEPATEAPAMVATDVNGAGGSPGHDPAHEGTAEALLGKGDTLLKLDQPEKALDCFTEALVADPANAEAMVRKGLALERLQRWEEAIAAYDLAIATDSSMTMAYLYKGGVFNRMERYGEALECYEKALKSQEKTPPAKVVVE